MVSHARLAVAVIWAISVTAVIGSVVLLVMSWDRTLADDLWTGFGGLSFATLSVAFATTGAIIAVRVSDNAVGRLFLLIGLLLGIGLLLYQYAAYGLTRSGGVPGMAIGRLAGQPGVAADSGADRVVADVVPRWSGGFAAMAAGGRAVLGGGRVAVGAEPARAGSHPCTVRFALQPDRDSMGSGKLRSSRGCSAGCWRSSGSVSVRPRCSTRRRRSSAGRSAAAQAGARGRRCRGRPHHARHADLALVAARQPRRPDRNRRAAANGVRCRRWGWRSRATGCMRSISRSNEPPSTER